MELAVFQTNGLPVARPHLPQYSEALFPGSEAADVKEILGPLSVNHHSYGTDAGKGFSKIGLFTDINQLFL